MSVYELEREEDGRWIAELTAIGYMAYGQTADEAIAAVDKIAADVAESIKALYSDTGEGY